MHISHRKNLENIFIAITEQAQTSSFKSVKHLHLKVDTRFLAI